MKLKEGLLTGENAVYNRLIHNSYIGCSVVSCLVEDTTEAAIVEKLRPMYDLPGAEVEAGVANFLAKLREIDALDE